MTTKWGYLLYPDSDDLEDYTNHLLDQGVSQVSISTPENSDPQIIMLEWYGSEPTAPLFVDAVRERPFSSI